MRFVLSALASLVALGLLWAWGLTSGQVHLSSEQPSEFAVVNDFMAYLPDSDFRRGLEAFFSEVSNVHGGASESFEEANIEFFNRHPCYAELASRFYSQLRISAYREQYETYLTDWVRGKRRLGLRASLADEAGKGVFSTLEPGWLWQEAMEFSLGDPNLAMRLIGLCGHDEAISRLPEIPEEVFHPTRRAELRELSQLRSSLLRRIANRQLTTEEGNHALALLDLEIEYLSDFEERELRCPWMTMYVPKSLGSEVDIDDSLKRSIGQIQAPRQGLQVLPAKAYHFIGAARLACIAREKGLRDFGPIDVGSRLQRGAAVAYRAQELCRVLRRYQRANFRSLFDPEKGSSYWIAEYYTLRKQFGCRKTEPTLDCVDSLSEPMSLNESDIRMVFSDRILGEPEQSEETLERYLERKKSRIDAAELWNEWHPRISIEGLPELCLHQASQHSSMYNPLDLLRLLAGGNHCRNDWSHERCSRALQVMREWEVDFVWTAQAHSIGARFGYQNCRSRVTESQLETQACRALARGAHSSEGFPSGRLGRGVQSIDEDESFL